MDINYTPEQWPEQIKKLKLDKLSGSKYTFPAGDSIKVIEIKLREKVQGKIKKICPPSMSCSFREK